MVGRRRPAAADLTDRGCDLERSLNAETIEFQASRAGLHMHAIRPFTQPTVLALGLSACSRGRWLTRRRRQRCRRNDCRRNGCRHRIPSTWVLTGDAGPMVQLEDLGSVIVHDAAATPDGTIETTSAGLS